METPRIVRIFVNVNSRGCRCVLDTGIGGDLVFDHCAITFWIQQIVQYAMRQRSACLQNGRCAIQSTQEVLF